MNRRAILFDRDGTLIVDAPPNSDPAAIQLMPRAADAVVAAREHGYFVGVVTNQPGAVPPFRVHARIEELIGRIDGWFVCVHLPEDACSCRKPQPGLIAAAARRFGIETAECAVIGDIGSDMEAARAAGACGVLVPTHVTRVEEIASAPAVANDVLEAVYAIVDGVA